VFQHPVLWIGISFDADPDPDQNFIVDADPDPDPDPFFLFILQPKKSAYSDKRVIFITTFS
jgi:hypothetical protein